MSPPRVVITGAAGMIGKVLTQRFAANYDVVGVDQARSRSRGTQKADLTRLSSAVRALAGADTVIDLAADPHTDAPWDTIHRNNLPVTLNVLEAARQVGARRVVFASSNQINIGYEQDQPYADIVAGHYDGHNPGDFARLTVDLPPRPENFYGIGKIVGEEAARLYSQEHGLSVICVRIGTVNGRDRPRTPRHFATWLSHADAGRIFECCVEAPPEIRYARFYGVSDNRWRIWDIDDAREMIGYAPVDDAEQWRGAGDPPPPS